MAKTFTDSNGYRRFSNSGTLVHRWAAEKKLGRGLKNGEVVHHVDRDKRNNRPGNLYVCKNQAHHDRLHQIDARRFGNKASYKGF